MSYKGIAPLLQLKKQEQFYHYKTRGGRFGGVHELAKLIQIAAAASFYLPFVCEKVGRRAKP